MAIGTGGQIPNTWVCGQSKYRRVINQVDYTLHIQSNLPYDGDYYDYTFSERAITTYNQWSDCAKESYEETGTKPDGWFEVWKDSPAWVAISNTPIQDDGTTFHEQISFSIPGSDNTMVQDRYLKLELEYSYVDFYANCWALYNSHDIDDILEHALTVSEWGGYKLINVFRDENGNLTHDMTVFNGAVLTFACGGLLGEVPQFDGLPCASFLFNQTQGTGRPEYEGRFQGYKIILAPSSFTGSNYKHISYDYNFCASVPSPTCEAFNYNNESYVAISRSEAEGPGYEYITNGTC